MGAERPHDTLLLFGRRGTVEGAVGGGHLLGPGDLRLVLGDVIPLGTHRLEQQLRAQLLEPRGEAPPGVAGEDRLGPRQADRPAVEPGVEPHDRYPGLGVAGDDCPLDRGGAAPAGKQRRVDVEDLVALQERLPDERAVGADYEQPGPRRLDRLHRGGRVDVLRLQELQAQLPRRLSDRRGGEPAPPTGGTVGTGDHQPRRAAALADPAQEAGGKAGGTQVGEFHRAVSFRAWPRGESASPRGGPTWRRGRGSGRHRGGRPHAG